MDKNKKPAASLAAVGGVNTKAGGFALRRQKLLVLAGLMVVAALVAVLVPRARAGVSHRGPAALHVNPFPGTPDAAADSPIIFSSLTAPQLRSVTVRGSRSGSHRGRVETLPQGAGIAFVPAKAFAPGERVRVTAHLSSPAAGTASGDPGARTLQFSFGVRVPVPSPPTLSDPGPAAPAASTASSSAYNTFHSAPNLHPTKVHVSHDPDTRSGDIFISPDHTYQRGPIILNSAGQLVWFLPVAGKASDFAVQSYQGKPVLTWWEGPHQNGKDGYDVIMNTSYKQLRVVKAVGTGYSADLHEFQITPQGTAFINTVVPVKANLSSVGGPVNGYVWDNVIQEIDIKTGKQLWSWHSYGHIPLNATHKLPAGAYCDCYHLNSIQQLSDGSILVSSRSTWSVYKISTKTGHIVWTLGGKYNQFKRGTGVGWSWQHDARRNGNTLTLFDDGAAPQEEKQSSAKVFALHIRKKSVTLVHRYTHSPPLLSSAQGSAETLPNGHMFVGWGTEPYFSEYSKRGKQIMTGSFPLGETSYRAFRFQWSGQPTWSPSLAVTAGSSTGAYNVWASWNGATSVATWRVLAGTSTSALSAYTTKARTSFETKIPITPPPGTQYVEVQALNSQGQVLPNGTSAPQSVG
jgi:hypothetical protein